MEGTVDWLGEIAQRQPDLIPVMDITSGRRHTFGSFDRCKLFLACFKALFALSR